MGKFIIAQRKCRTFYFKLIADDGQTLLTKEGYGNKIAASVGANRVKSIVANEEAFKKMTLLDGRLYFILVSDGLRMGASEDYDNEAEADNAIAAVRRYAPDAIVEEL